MKYANLRGKLIYVSEKTGTDREFGREWFSISRHEDGQITVRAQCEIDSGVVRKRSVVRDVVCSLDSNNRPLDCFVRLHENGQYLGAGWFRFDDNKVFGTLHNRHIGHVEQRFEVDGPIPSVGAHPLVCDMLHCLAFDTTRNERVQRSRRIMMTSRELDGCSGPELTWMDMDIEYLGRETITVPAGTFQTEHFCFPFPSGEYPEEHVWFVPEELLFVRVRVGEGLKSRYDLVAVERDGDLSLRT
jgi:hypothetical protein